MAKLKITQGSTVEVITGADKGKKGSVLNMNPRTMQVQVQGVKMQTHFDKEDGLKKKEGFIHYSNLKLVEKAAAKTKKKKKKKTKTSK